MSRFRTCPSPLPSGPLGNTVLYLLLAAVGVAVAQNPANQETLLLDEANTIAVVETYGPSVVAIIVEHPGSDSEGEWQGAQVEATDPPRRSSGSGFVATERGGIVTSFQVIRTALFFGSVELDRGASISVVFPDQPVPHPARVVGANPDVDLALLELVDAGSVPVSIMPIPMADQLNLRVGQKVIAIGNPFGLTSTVTTGIISAQGRELTTVGQVDIGMIQTDAAVNFGHSGGPLLNSRGELVGIITSTVSGTDPPGPEASLGVGFAIPAHLLSENLAGLEHGGLIGRYARRNSFAHRPRIGLTVTGLDSLSEQIRFALGMPDRGLIVQQVAPGSPGEKAGLIGPQQMVTVYDQELRSGGDVILEADGTAVGTATELQRILLEREEGETVELTVWREGKLRTVTVTLAVIPATESPP